MAVYDSGMFAFTRLVRIIGLVTDQLIHQFEFLFIDLLLVAPYLIGIRIIYYIMHVNPLVEVKACSFRVSIRVFVLVCNLQTIVRGKGFSSRGSQMVLYLLLHIASRRHLVDGKVRNLILLQGCVVGSDKRIPVLCRISVTEGSHIHLAVARNRNLLDIVGILHAEVDIKHTGLLFVKFHAVHRNIVPAYRTRVRSIVDHIGEMFLVRADGRIRRIQVVRSLHERHDARFRLRQRGRPIRLLVARLISRAHAQSIIVE